MIQNNYFHADGSQSAYNIGEIHHKVLFFSWIILANIGLWAHFFKYRPWALLLHKIAMATLTVLTVLAVFMAIFYFGLDNGMPNPHIQLGLALAILCIITSTGGVICSIAISTPFVNPSFVKLIRQIHKTAGWAVLILILIQFISTQSQQVIIPILIVNLISYGLFLFLKLTRNQMQEDSMKNIVENNKKNWNLRQIKTKKDLQIYNKDYFIFANKIYDINQVINSHPGGWEIIKIIRARQVDRYLYGIQPLENWFGKGKLIHQHSNAILSLMGQPYAKLYSTVFYKNFYQTNSASIEELGKPCKNESMHAVYLGSKSQRFEYTGYHELSELGKYYTLNMGKQTKLYSIVNFLHASNLDIMSRIAGNIFWEKNRVIFYDGKVHQVVSTQQREKQSQYLLPLFIKKYENGAFTRKFLSGNCTDQVLVSTPMGRGLSLHEVPPGIILILAAGTGLNPFCDLIDLTYKQCLITQRHQLSDKLIRYDPILSSTPFKNWYLVLYVSVQSITEIHPITLYQCNQLAKRNRISIKIRSRDSNSLQYEKYQKIQKIYQKFQFVLKEWVEKASQLSQIYICGTPEFNGSIASQLKNQFVSLEKYKIM